jgi:hypothetical protein
MRVNFQEKWSIQSQGIHVIISHDLPHEGQQFWGYIQCSDRPRPKDHSAGYKSLYFFLAIKNQQKITITLVNNFIIIPFLLSQFH